MDKNHFNNFKIFGNPSYQVMYQKPTFEEVYRMIINEEKHSIVNESVFRKELFQELFNFLKDTQLKFFTTFDLMEYFPIKSKPFKILRKNKNKNFYKLYVVNNDLSNKDVVKNILIKVSSDLLEINDEDVEDIHKNLNISSALFTPLDNGNDFGILWLHKNKSTLEDFEHEFIHYLEWISGCYASDFNADDKYFEEEEMFKKIFKIYNEDDINYFLRKEEYQTLLNGFLNDLENLKSKYFSDWSGLRFAKYISSNLLKGEKQDVTSYLNHIKEYEYFKFLNSLPAFGFPMVVAYNCMNYKIMNIRNHIFGRFNE